MGLRDISKMSKMFIHINVSIIFLMNIMIGLGDSIKPVDIDIAILLLSNNQNEVVTTKS